MGLGNALRKVWPSPSPTPDPHPESPALHRDSSPHPRRSRNRSSVASQRRKQPSLAHRPSTHAGPGRRRRPAPTYLTQQQAQERAVIASYRDQLQKLADRIISRWAQFDAEPDEYNVTLELRDLRSSLQKALESYYAAVGARSNAGIEHVLQTMEETDVRLAKLDHEVMAEVERFEQAAMDVAERFSAAQLPAHTLHVCADADDVLIELELYRDGWGHIMDRETRSRLDHANAVLREVVASCALPMAQHAPAFANGSYSFPIVTGIPQRPGYSDSVGLREGITPYYGGDQMFASPSFDTYDAVLRSQQQGMYTAANQNGNWHNPDRRWGNPHAIPNGQSPQAAVASSASQRDSQSPSNDRKDTQSSESGDEGAMQMVMSRTRTLRDMAETAMSQRDDVRGNVPTESAGSSYDAFSNRKGGATGNGRSSNGSHRDSRKASRSSYQSAGVEQPAMEQTHHTSFASTLYHTRHERVDAISDVGVFLQRSNVRGDGRCLFRALARCRAVARGNSIPGERAEREEADHLRERAVAELIKYRELLARFFVIEGNFAQYTKKMSHPRTYGGEPELLMLAKILHVPIAVYISKNGSYRQIQVYGKQYRGDPLRILYSDGIHYDALLAYR